MRHEKISDYYIFILINEDGAEYTCILAIEELNGNVTEFPMVSGDPKVMEIMCKQAQMIAKQSGLVVKLIKASHIEEIKRWKP